MKGFKKFISRPVVIVLLLVMAVGLLLGTGVEGTRAVLNQESSPFHANVEVASIDVALLENGSLVANNGYNGGNPSGELKLPEIVDGKAKLGYKYPEELSVQNTGSISQFVRVTVLKYWKEKGSDKRIDLDPSYIVLEETNDGWVKDANASTSEREVFYYLPVLEPGQTTPALSSTLSISPEVLNKKTEENYTYDDLEFHLEAKVDAIQNHHAPDAIKSVWGISVSGDENHISLN